MNVRALPLRVVTNNKALTLATFFAMFISHRNEPEDDEMDHDMNDEEQEEGVRISLLLSFQLT